MKQTINEFFKDLKSKSDDLECVLTYTSPVKLNKSYLTESGEKQPNPYADKLLKTKEIKFNFGETFKETMLKINPEYEFKERSGDYQKTEDFDVLQTGKNGLYLAVLPKPFKGETIYLEQTDNGLANVELDLIEKYLPPKREFVDNGKPIINQLMVDRIQKIECNGETWLNEEYVYGDQN